jgi:4-hydroxyphenylpyruvate dioxygenase
VSAARGDGGARPDLGLVGVDALRFYVHDLERSRRFYTGALDFAEIAASAPDPAPGGGERSVAFQAGGVRIVCTAPGGEDGPAARFLRRHPDGVGEVAFAVEDAERCFRVLEERGGTPTGDLEEHRAGGGLLRTFAVTTPLAATTFRFVERRGPAPLLPGLVDLPAPRGGANAFGFTAVDHLTSNFATMKPALLWMEHVLGLEEFWEVSFHTKDAARRAEHEAHHGSGLRSVVMRDPRSGVKFANNEPWRPAFTSSQIHRFVEDHRGDGIQHAALEVADIVPAVRAMRARGVEFMPTPAAYYDALPGRIASSGIGRIEEDVALLRDLEILVDGAGPGAYLLQIFLREASGLYGDPAAGPFFFEIIQRKGDQGFGAGNFRALFESIEREQLRERR